MVEIGTLFPVGGPVPLDRMIGREAALEELVRRLREGSHYLLDGPRRIGKTTLCRAACARLEADHDFVALVIETPQQSTAASFCNAVATRCAEALPRTGVRRGARKNATTVAEWLIARQLGVQLDLTAFQAEEVTALDRRAALALPLELARARRRRVVLFVDELQRAVEYQDGEGLVGDLVDLYAGNGEVTVLIDGSEERVIRRLLGEPYRVAKLATRHPLSPRIPRARWVEPLTERFREGGLMIEPRQLDRVLDFGDERPFATMHACHEAALTARRMHSDTIDEISVSQGIAAARRRLDDDA